MTNSQIDASKEITDEALEDVSGGLFTRRGRRNTLGTLKLFGLVATAGFAMNRQKENQSYKKAYNQMTS